MTMRLVATTTYLNEVGNFLLYCGKMVVPMSYQQAVTARGHQGTQLDLIGIQWRDVRKEFKSQATCRVTVKTGRLASFPAPACN